VLSWLAAHIIDILLIFAIVLTVVLIVRGMIRNKKAGKSACGCDCGSCGCGCGERSAH
jgi:asparagine N-glycosylation enzyme membrane subunit Stt3